MGKKTWYAGVEALGLEGVLMGRGLATGGCVLIRAYIQNWKSHISKTMIEINFINFSATSLVQLLVLAHVLSVNSRATTFLCRFFYQVISRRGSRLTISKVEFAIAQ